MMAATAEPLAKLIAGDVEEVQSGKEAISPGVVEGTAATKGPDLLRVRGPNLVRTRWVLTMSLDQAMQVCRLSRMEPRL